ncbi:hypothetical protein EJ05DRAFT_478911 [Pseudovirgaria hyperparasitica]|uniref:Glycine zipper 2TM domain-containing protein n=1 Tax=Pseudovirgaria hyperparasitica TaxID=470096 RepID=A0A6A6W257_9PEZI|nr:uncharacterized protein EJ05DRAFT_478911 [Pseudovirgaria hyperparasitica]KAF2755101.1 hypothetical protein EJ05DRAFT_478911 [Pseudovirgaria hyperparasitica]
MAETEAFIELGCTALTRAADKYHDTVWDRLPTWRKKQIKEQDREDRARETRTRSRSVPNNDYYVDDDRSRYPEQKGVLVRREEVYPKNRDYREETMIERVGGDRKSTYDTRNRYGDHGAMVTTRDSYAATYYPDGAPPNSAMVRNPHPADSIILERNRYRARSLSRSRSQSRHRSKSRHRRSGSHVDHDDDSKKRKYGPTIVGAVAGGLAGRNLGDGDRLTTVAAAIIGAVGAKHGYKEYEKRKSKKHHKEDRDWEDEHADDYYDDDSRASRAQFRGGRDGRIHFSKSPSRSRR